MFPGGGMNHPRLQVKARSHNFNAELILVHSLSLWERLHPHSEAGNVEANARVARIDTQKIKIRNRHADHLLQTAHRHTKNEDVVIFSFLTSRSACLMTV